MNSITCLTWIPRGVAKSVPDKLKLTPEELKILIEETRKETIECLQEQHEDDKEEMEGDHDQNPDADEPEEEKDFDARYNLNVYDDDDDNPIFNMADLTLYGDNKDDNYITVKDEEDEEEAEEKEDFTIKETDNILIVGHIESDSSVMEIYVYNKDDEAFYVHHDIVLPAYPLALEWLDFDPSGKSTGNFVAVGDMTQVIKVWDLDLVDVLEPEYELGIYKKKNKKKAENLSEGHSDAVLALSWNKNVRNVLASGSADSTVILWDLQNATAVNKLDYHNDKVQTLQWHPSESGLLLSGSVNGLVKLRDCKDLNKECKSWKIGGEVEKVLWDTSNPSNFYCSTDQGIVSKIDIRMKVPIYSFKAHEEAVTGLDISPQCPNTLLTAGMDKVICLWDVTSEPVLVKKEELKLGSIYAAKAAPDLDFTIAVGGNCESNNIQVIDVMEDPSCHNLFKDKLIPAVPRIKTECKDINMEGDEASASLSATHKTQGFELSENEIQSTSNGITNETEEEVMESEGGPSTSHSTKRKKRVKHKKNKM